MKKMFFFFHLPNEIPTQFREVHDLIYINYDEIIVVELDAKSFRMDLDLKEFPAVLRKCYFEDERGLKFFKMYSVSHCKLECLANITLEKFGCVRFYMPRDAKTRICMFSEQKNMTGPTEDLNGCECYPLCNDIKYSYKVEKVPITAKNVPDNFTKM